MWAFITEISSKKKNNIKGRHIAVRALWEQSHDWGSCHFITLLYDRFYQLRIQGSSVSIVTRLRVGRPSFRGSIPGRGNLFTSPKGSDVL
jgi:hypothetical protein